ncbi:MAC/perforin domain-containing protein [Paenimyroides baculatum]|uniref:MACPF domain-containing protein n=1 Tax=Paenimyroides baculatum TaxID=2608000 RepID=A0A5M6CL08_9FLAO|nr:MAC/perforin domain-containing protein [Paenimyroides baculatum]KAA5534005.1 hypothetical protein F0460_10025 [Paenimyroides baculatum]
MKTKNILLLGILSILFSCSPEEVQEDNNTMNSEMEAVTDSGYQTYSSGDGLWDVLGYGYDVKGDFADPTYAKANILKLNLLENENRLTSHTLTVSESSVIANYNATEYKKDVSTKVNLGGSGFFKLFDASLSGKFDKGVVANGAYSFGSSDYLILRKKFSIDIDPLDLTQYLTTNFREDADQLTPQAFTNIYGTHLIKTAYLGAKLSVSYTGSSTLNSSAKKTEAGLTVSFLSGKIFGLNVGAGYDSSYNYANKFANSQVYCKSIGGSYPIAIGPLDISNPTNVPTMNIDNWLNSITDSNSRLINFDSTSLLANYELVLDTKISNEIKNYIKTGINSYASDNLTEYTNFGQKTFVPGDMVMYYKANFDRVILMKTRRGRWIEVADVSNYNSTTGSYTTSLKNNLLIFPTTLPLLQASFTNENFEIVKQNSYISLVINQENGKKYMVYQNGYDKRAYLIKNDLTAQKYKLIYGLPTTSISNLDNFIIKVL